MPADLKSGSSLVGKILASGQVAAATTDTTIYTVPAQSAVRIVTFSICNVTSGSVTATVSVVPSGGTVDGTHKQLSVLSIAANTVVSTAVELAFLKDAYLEAGAFISVQCSAVTAINYLLTGTVSS